MLITITGPSGSGKTSLIKQLTKEFPNEIFEVISTTTREPRPYEVNGKDYNFINNNEFDKNFYGIKAGDINKENINDINKIIIVNINPKGMKMLKKHFHGVDKIYSIYLEVNEKLAKQRLAKRTGWNWKKASERIKVDKSAGLYNKDDFDCILNGHTSKKEKIENFLNYIESRKWIHKLNS